MTNRSETCGHASDHAVPEYALAVAEMLDAYAFRIRQGKNVQELGRDIRHLGTILERRT